MVDGLIAVRFKMAAVASLGQIGGMTGDQVRYLTARQYARSRLLSRQRSRREEDQQESGRLTAGDSLTAPSAPVGERFFSVRATI